MSDTVLIVLLIVIAVIIIVFFLRKRISHFFFKANKEGLEANIDTNQERKNGVEISGTTLRGENCTIDVSRDNVKITDVVENGKGHKIAVRADNKKIK
jgi:hypothetical protein